MQTAVHHQLLTNLIAFDWFLNSEMSVRLFTNEQEVLKDALYANLFQQPTDPAYAAQTRNFDQAAYGLPSLIYCDPVVWTFSAASNDEFEIWGWYAQSIATGIRMMAQQYDQPFLVTQLNRSFYLAPHLRIGPPEE